MWTATFAPCDIYGPADYCTDEPGECGPVQACAPEDVLVENVNNPPGYGGDNYCRGTYHRHAARGGECTVRVGVSHYHRPRDPKPDPDPDPEPTPTTLTLSADPAPAEGGDPVTVTTTLDNPAPANGTTVTLTTGGTATLDTDYTLSSTTITIAEGQRQGTATITVTDDAEDDDGKTIVIDAESTNPGLTAPPLTLTIEDDDACR